jgi:metal-responsive CopG/Arc/MetJ family transcriptional regulator
VGLEFAAEVSSVARTHVVLDDGVLDAIDRVAGQRGRSRFLEEAAREKLARMDLERTLRRTSGSVDRAKHPEWADAEATAKWVREIRAESA